jgi:sigma-B regulation protein RsbU (phosphoserine phosphatase)
MIVCGYILILVFVLVISFRVSRPLRELAQSVDKFGDGNYDVELPNVKGHDEIALLTEAFSRMQASIKENINAQKNLGRIERELDFARNIQLAMLPESEKDEICDDDRHELAPFILPAKEVGGDFYDFFKIDNDRLCVVVGDVSGKGVPAALFMMVSRIILRTMMKNLKSVVKTFNSTNYALAKRNKQNMFVTVWMGVIDLRSGHVEFASAGHNPPAVRHEDGSVEFIPSRSGLVIAAMENVQYRQQVYDLKPGDTLFLYTDGVTEATNSKNELFGDARLLKTLAKSKGLKTADVCKFVKKEIDLFVQDVPQFDDITMLSVKYIGNGEPVWERYEKTIDVVNGGKHELKNFVDKIFSPMDVSAKEQMRNAWERYEKIVDVIPENQVVLTAFVEGILAHMERSAKSQMQINIAIDEIYSNIVKFSGATKVTLIVEVRKATLTAKLTFIDDGMPYDPLKNKDPDITLSAEEREVGGLGIFIVKKTMDSVCYRRNGDNNELAITKTL